MPEKGGANLPVCRYVRQDVTLILKSEIDEKRQNRKIAYRVMTKSFLTTGSIGLGIVGYLLLCVGAFWCGFRFSEASDSVAALVTESKYGQIKIGLRSYYLEHGKFPPPKYQSNPTDPFHSWRVLIVPHSIGDDEYKNYDFSQMWNSSNNMQALGGPWPGRFFRNDYESSSTTVLAVGEGDKWPASKPLMAELVTKGEDRFLLVEHPNSQIHWMKPEY